ncbi:MAG TPA: zf-HC2 domain-containing protein [Sedimentisphaerales bacterium]|nr:zf-HC2 domain-containing protein [Sedimentisphaerales bacterium]
MDSDCEKTRDRIADFLTGTLSDAEAEAMEQHLGVCAGCRMYERALRQEDRLLDELVATFSAEMTRREDEVINVIGGVDVRAAAPTVWSAGAWLKNLLARHAAAAAVIVVVGLYFVITFSWVSEITAVIRYGL